MRVRTMVIGILAVIAMTFVIPRCDFFGIGTHVAHTYLPIAPIFIFFMLTLVLNSILRAFKCELAPTELLLIYIMMTMACGLGPGCIHYIMPTITAPYYYATPANRFAEVLHQYIPGWIVPKDPTVIKYYYEGLPAGTPLPWGAWAVPVFMWSLLMIAVISVGFSLATILRKQWVENEKLVFPLVQIPLEMVKQEEGAPTSLPPLFRNKLMWLAFLIPAILYTFRGLHFYFPIVPDTGGLMTKFIPFTEKPWNSLQNIFLQILFTTIGLTYFVPSSVSFSIWFFFLVFQLETLIGAILGFPMPYFPGEAFNRAFHGYQVAGGIIALAFLSFWAMRHTITGMFKKACSREKSSEATSFRLTFAGIICGFIIICFWGVAAGVKLWTVVLYFLIFFSIITVVSRLVAEAGLFYVGYKIFPFEVMMPFTGTKSVGGPGLITSVMWNQGIQREFRVDTMPFFLNNMKMADVAKIDKRSALTGVWVAVFVGLIAVWVNYLALFYKYGAVNIGSWTTGFAQNAARSATSYIVSPLAPNLKDVMTMAIGAGVTAFLFFMTRVFLWWPFHPIGFVMAGSYSIYHMWWPVFIGWLAKVLILKLGGIKVFQKLVPFFMGLILGECVIIGTWVCIDLALGTRGNFLIWL